MSILRKTWHKTRSSKFTSVWISLILLAGSDRGCFRIGVNRTLDYLRRQKRRGRWALFSEGTIERPPDPSVADPRNDIDLKQEVRAVIEKIPEKYRTVLVLRDLENFSTSEIAAILDRKEATIRWRLAEARNRFEQLWSKRQNDGSNAADSEMESDEL